MKTTLDLPDDLLIEAKTVAARRRISLKAMVEHALLREIEPTTPQHDTPFVRGEDGVLRLPHRGARVTTELVRQLMDEEGI
jgi:hypothetical protein